LGSGIKNGDAREYSGSRPAWQSLGGIDWDYRGGWFAGAGLRHLNAGTVRLDGKSGAPGELKTAYKGLGAELRLGRRF
jgi:hypothetical protein